MQIRRLLAIVLLVIYSLTIDAQRPDCSYLKQRCVACVRRLSNPTNNLEMINRTCREKLRRRYVWGNVNRCDMQEFACRAHNRRLDCEQVALMAGMQRRLP